MLNPNFGNLIWWNTLAREISIIYNLRSRIPIPGYQLGRKETITYPLCFKNTFFVSNSLKQWTVSKERPGSIITVTLKNEIFIPINISKELDFYLNFRYISLIKSSWILIKLSSYLQTWRILRSLPEERWRMHIFFSQALSLDTTRPLPVLFSPSASSQMFETAIMSRIVKRWRK